MAVVSISLAAQVKPARSPAQLGEVQRADVHPCVKLRAMKPSALPEKSAALAKASLAATSVLAAVSTSRVLRVKMLRAANLARRVKVQVTAAHQAAASATVRSAVVDFTRPPGA